MSAALPARAKAYFQAFNSDPADVEALHAPGSVLCFADGACLAADTAGSLCEALAQRWSEGLKPAATVEDVFLSAREHACFALVEVVTAPEGVETRRRACFELEFAQDGSVASASEYNLVEEVEGDTPQEPVAWAKGYFEAWSNRDVEAIQKLHAAESQVYLPDQVQHGPSAEEIGKGCAKSWEREQGELQLQRLFARTGASRVLALRARRGAAPCCEAVDFDADGKCTSFVRGTSERSLHRLATAIRLGPAPEVLELLSRGLPLLVEVDLEDKGKPLGTGTWLDLAVLLRRYKLCLQLLRLALPAKPEEPADLDPGLYEPCCLGDWGDEVALELPEEAAATPDELGQKVLKLVEASRFALAWAAHHGQAQLVELLLAAGAAPAAEDPSGRTPLLAAAVAGRKTCLSVLLKAGVWDMEPRQAEVDEWLQHWKLDKDELVRDEEPAPPPAPLEDVAPAEEAAPDLAAEFEASQKELAKLQRAIASAGAAEVSRLLTADACEACFDLDPLGATTGNVLDLLLLHRRYRIAEQLLRSDRGEAVAPRCSRAVAWAARDGQGALVEELLKKGARAEQCDDCGRSALLLAATRGHRRCVAALAAATSEEASMDKVQEWVAFWKMDVDLPPPAAGDVIG